MINADDLDKILKIAEKYNFSRLEFQQENSKVIIEKGDYLQPKVKESIEAATSENYFEEKLINKKEERTYIKSSLAGTFYLSKEENAEPLVKVKDIVKEDTIVGLIEVMKLFNEIEAGVSGEIIDILVENGEFVEYGQPLFEVKGSGK